MFKLIDSRMITSTKDDNKLLQESNLNVQLPCKVSIMFCI